MKALVALAAAALATVALASVATADSINPFPATKVGDVFVAAQTVTTDGTMANWFAPGATVVFRAYAVDPTTKLPVVAKDVRYFYVTIPGQPNVKLKYDATAPGASAGLPWTGQWVVPATYTPGTVNFKVLIQTRAKNGKQLRGQFVQFPVASAMLTISASAPPAFSPGLGAGSAGAGSGSAALDL